MDFDEESINNFDISMHIYRKDLSMIAAYFLGFLNGVWMMGSPRIELSGTPSGVIHVVMNMTY